MTRQFQDMEFLIITPTYHRESLLVRFLKQVKSQTYGCWRLLVVHDGPNPLTEQLVGRFALDPRIEYLHTPTRGNDFGVTPRLEVLRHAVRTNPPDSAVFWGDDDYFVRTALETIAASLKAANYPALLAVSQPLAEPGHHYACINCFVLPGSDSLLGDRSRGLCD